MNKKLFHFQIHTLIGIGLGVSLFSFMMMCCKIPIGPLSVNMQTCYGIGGFFSALFGPIAGSLTAFIGHFVADSLNYGAKWSWIIASGVCGFIIGLVYPKLHTEDGILSKKDLLVYNITQIMANIVAWIIVAPVLDIVIYAKPAAQVFPQGAVVCLSNAVSAGIIGSGLLLLYSKTRAKKGSPTKE